ncbi:hypothetical protein BKA61DRAFT_668729 [Leptodontidium sp. MPI-SDFR-AT-0119]|nr:hypothetical protein BKA61DRAFT_668729 [Leptodontidium sp. MPI-SDFR-AT-0119]
MNSAPFPNVALSPPPPGAMTPPPAPRKPRGRPRRLSSVSPSPDPRTRIPLHTGDLIGLPATQTLFLPAPTTSTNSTVAVGRSTDQITDQITAAVVGQDTTPSGVASAASEQVESPAASAVSPQHQTAVVSIEEDTKDRNVEQGGEASAGQQ